MKLNRTTILKMVSDVGIIVASLILAYILKFKSGTVYTHAQIEPYLESAVVMVSVWLLIFITTGVYRDYKGVMPEIDDSFISIKAATAATLVIMATTFIYPIMPNSRFVVMYMWVISCILLACHRLALYWVEAKWLKRRPSGRYAIIIGGNHVAQDIAEKIIMYPSYKLVYSGHICDNIPEKLHFHLMNRFRRLGNTKETLDIIQKQKPDVIFLTELEPDLKQQLIGYCNAHGIILNILSKDIIAAHEIPQVYTFDGLPFLSYKETQYSWMYYATKRGLDIIFSGVSLIILSPLLISAMSLIKCTSSQGSVFYYQTRVGKGGRPFSMIKLRTMVPDAEKNGPQYVKEGTDDRYIPGGEFLRRYSIDELPQLFNVLAGQMSIVGPRPERPFFVEKYAKEIPHYMDRHQVKGGITGWAQINGRSVLTRRTDHKFKYDLYYIKNRSILFDIKIVLKTFSIVLKGEEAY